MVFTVLGAVAELERIIIRERVIAGQKAVRRRGVRIGRPNAAVSVSQVEKLREQVSVGVKFRLKQGLRKIRSGERSGLSKNDDKRHGLPRRPSLTVRGRDHATLVN